VQFLAVEVLVLVVEMGIDRGVAEEGELPFLDLDGAEMPLGSGVIWAAV